MSRLEYNDDPADDARYSAETGEPLAATGGIGSWCLMLRHLPAHLKSEPTWLLKDLELPLPKES